MQRGRTQLGRGFLLLTAVLALSATPARALVLHEGVTGAAVHPADSAVGRWGANASCVAVGTDMVATTRHQGGGLGNIVVFGGEEYEVTEFFYHHEADLRLARVVPTGGGGDLSPLPLYDDSLDPPWKDETAYTAVLGGYGKGRGADLYAGPIHYGYGWTGETNTVLRWGENVVAAPGTANDPQHGFVTDVIVADFDPPGGSGAAAEAIPAEFDSGCGWYLNLGNPAHPDWHLAGLTRGVTHETESWFRQPSGDPPGDTMDAVRVGSYAAWIDAVVHPHTWLTDADADWFDAANWSGGVPDETERWALFGDVLTAPRTVTLSEQVTLGTLRIDAGESYRFADGLGETHWLVFDSDEDVARIEVNRLNRPEYHGAHTIETTIWLRSPLLVNQRSSGELTLAATVGGNGSITKRGGGTVVFAADNGTTLSSEFVVERGVLCAAHAGALGSGKVRLVGGDLCLRADADALFPNQVEATANADLHVEPLTGGAGARLALGEFKTVGSLHHTVTGSDGYGLAVDGWTRFTLGTGSVATLETASADFTCEGPVQMTGGTLRKTGPGALVFAATDPADLDFWEQTTLQVADGTARFLADAGAADRRNLTAAVETGGAIEFDSTQHLARVEIADGTVTCLPDGGRTLVTDELALAETAGVPDGLLDLTNNNLVVDYAGIGPSDSLHDEIEAWVAAGYNGGAWNADPGSPAAGISTAYAEAGVHALGVLDNGAPPMGVDPLSALDGVPLADLLGDPYAIIVRFTYFGDADLDGEVDFDDVQRLIQSWNTPPADPRWAAADFNYDDRIDFMDVQLLIAGWNNQGAPLSESPTALAGGDGTETDLPSAGEVTSLDADVLPPASVPVPEPATFLLAAAGALALLARRRGTAQRPSV
jgi:hypothetical protein